MHTWSGCGQRDESGDCWSRGVLLGLRVNSESPGAPLASMRVLRTGPRAWHCRASNSEGLLPQHHRLSGMQASDQQTLLTDHVQKGPGWDRCLTPAGDTLQDSQVVSGLQVTRRACGCMWTPPTRAVPSSALSSGIF